MRHLIFFEMMGRMLNPWGMSFGIPAEREVADDDPEMHYMDCGVAGGFPHPASAHPIAVPTASPVTLNSPLTPDEALAMLNEDIFARGEPGAFDWLTEAPHG